MKQKHIEIIALFDELYTLFPRLSDDQAAIYAQHLELFTLNAVRLGVKHAAAKWTSASKFPPVALILEGCKTVGMDTSSGVRSKRYPWEEQQFRARKLATDFMRGYEQSPDVQQAHAEGWDADLLKYARAAAAVQAKLLAGLQNIGLDPVLFNWGVYDLALFDRRKAALMEQCRRQAELQVIAVEIPQEAISFWREDLQRPRPRINDRNLHARMPKSSDGWFEQRTAEILAERAQQASPEAMAAAQVGAPLPESPAEGR